MNRRMMLSSIGTLLLAGCSASNPNPEPDNTPNTSTKSPTAEAFPIEISKSITTEPGDYHHIPLKLEMRGELSYTVTGNTDFDVYMFKDGYDSGWEAYQDYQDGREDENSDGMVGISDENADGEAEAGPSPLSDGTYHFVVDHTDFGGRDGAKIESETPSLEANIDIEIVKQGF